MVKHVKHFITFSGNNEMRYSSPTLASFRFSECMASGLNKSAFLVLAIGFATAMLIVAGSGLVQHDLLTMIGVIIGMVVAVYTVNAAGYLVMNSPTDESAIDGPVRPLTALRWSVVHGHSLLCVLLLQVATLAALATITGLILALCKLPSFGMALYACFLPILTLGTAVVFVCCAGVLSLAGPAIWGGNNTMSCVKILMRIPSRHWMAVFGQLAQMCALVSGISALIVVFLALGSAVVSLLAGKVLLSEIDLLLDQNSGQQLAENIGSLIAWGLASMVPLLVLISGVCQIGRNVLGALIEKKDY